MTPPEAWTRAQKTWPGLIDQDMPADVQARIHRIRNGLERDLLMQLTEMQDETGAPRARTRRVVVRLVRELREATALDHALFSAFCRERAADELAVAAE